MRSLTRKSFFELSLFVLILLMAGSVFAANNTLNVTCVDESGKILANAKVEIQALGNPKWQDKKTDKQGVARFDKIDDGVYRIVARPEGMQPALYELVQIRNGAQESVSITCAPGDPLKKFYFEDPTLNNQAQTSMREAMTSFQSNNFEEAEKNLRNSLTFNPSNPDTLYYLAVALVQQKKWDEAESTLKKASRIANALVSLPQQKDAKGELQPSPYKPIAQMIDSLLPNLPVLKLRVEATDEMAQKNFKQAVAKYEEAIKVMPNDPDTYYNMALALGSDKQFDQATAALDKAIALKPDDKAYQDLKTQIAALKLNEVLAKAKVVVDEGNALYKEKNYAGALQKYEAALPMIPEANQSSVLAQIGRSHTMLNQPDQAVIAYKSAIAQSPANDKTTYEKALGQHYLIQKQYEQAFATFEAAGLNLFTLGQEWSRANETDLALAAFERVLKTDPANTEAYFELGTLYYYNKKDYAKAKEALTKFIEVGTDEKKKDQAKDLIAVIDRKK